MRLMKLAPVAVFAALAFSALGATSASVAHPLFLNKEDKRLLLFVGENAAGTTPILRGTGGDITCEKILVDGFTLTKSPLAHGVLLHFHGKCVEHELGANLIACSEPISVKKLLAELGLVLGNKTVGILLEPSDGTTEFTTIRCGTHTTTVLGAVIGEIPEITKERANQYNKLLTTVEVVFESEAKAHPKQNITEIVLLGMNMRNIKFDTGGFIAGEASLEFTAIVKTDELGGLEICTKELVLCP
jgi:hypothetical protein